MPVEGIGVEGVMGVGGVDWGLEGLGKLMRKKERRKSLAQHAEPRTK